MGVILHAVKLIFFQADPSKLGTRWRRATSAKTLIVMGSGLLTLTERRFKKN